MDGWRLSYWPVKIWPFKHSGMAIKWHEWPFLVSYTTHALAIAITLIWHCYLGVTASFDPLIWHFPQN